MCVGWAAASFARTVGLAVTWAVGVCVFVGVVGAGGAYFFYPELHAATLPEPDAVAVVRVRHVDCMYRHCLLLITSTTYFLVCLTTAFIIQGRAVVV
jgi:hypothetical protein